MENKIYDLTAPQRSILYTEKYYNGSSVNNICATEFIKEKIDFDALKTTIRLLVTNNDIFNFKLHLIDNTLKQELKKCDFEDVEIVSLNSIEDVHILENNMMKHVFDLEKSEYFEFKLFRLSDNTGGVILNIHHLFGDSWTLGLVANEIIRIYNCLINNLELNFDNSFSYIDYINAEKEYINSKTFLSDKDYWNSKFKTIPDHAYIPSEKYSNKLDFSCKANRLSFEIDKNIMSKINNLCATLKISTFNFFMAVYSLYLGKVSNTNDFVIGTPILNRTNFKQKHTMGMFINTVPVRINLDKDDNFKDFVTNISTDFITTLRHQKYSYQHLLEDLRSTNSNISNLYDILISYQITNANSENCIDYETSWSFNGNSADDLQIHIYDINNTGSATVAYDYKVSKYNEIDINNFHLRILNIINQILDNNSIGLHDIELICEDEKNSIISCNTLANNYKNSVIELIEEVTKNNPNSIAISFNNVCITYSELLSRVYKLSNYLLSKNIQANSNIGILTCRNIDTIVGILAIMKINCTFVPIDVEYPTERINYMIETSLVDTILYSSAKLTFDNNSLNFIDINYESYQNYNNIVNNSFDYNYDNNLYIIFTSGSTGKPKGVTLSHKNMLNLLSFEKNNTFIFDDSINHKVLQFATMSFDVSYQEIFSTLTTASTLVLIDDTSRKNIQKLCNTIIENNIDILFIPPAYLKLLVEDLDIVNKLSLTLKNIITAGEALILTDGTRKLLDLGVKIHNHYGPAETHVATTYTLTNSNVADTVPIGTPINNCNVYILNDYKKLCPKYCVGEIAIAGECVGNGYFNNVSATCENFVEDIFNKDSKMYLTRDLGYIDYSGIIHYVGRKDFALKINGFRIELSEIDNVLQKYEGVNSCITCVQVDYGVKHIITYYTGPNEITEDVLLNYLRSILPFYMIPKRVVFLKSLPINNNGKIARNLLPKINLTDSYNEYEEVSTPTQTVLQEIFKKLLNVEKVGANYNFFEIGGDSLIAIKLCSIISEKFNINIEVKDIFNMPILKDLANFIDNHNSNNNILKLVKAPKSEYYPLSSAQKRIYYASLASENPLLYNICGGVIFDNILDSSKVKDCFNSIIKLHSAFRTRFEIIDNEPKQVVLDHVDFDIEIFNEDEKNVNDIVNNFPKKFNFENAPLLRVGIYYLNNEKTLIVIDSHHIVLDGTSLNILFNNFYNIYFNDVIEILPLSYCDYAVWENNYINSSEITPYLNYWTSKFNNLEISPINLPYKKIDEQISYNGNVISKKISKELFDKLSELSKNLGISNYMLFLSCFYILLNTYTNQDEIIVGTPIANRQFMNANSIIGMFVNNLPIYSKIDKNISIGDFINNIKNTVLEALANQNVPYDLLVKSLNLKNINLFDVMFIYQNIYDDNSKFANIVRANTNTSKFNLSLEFIPTSYTLFLEYKTELFDIEFVDSLLLNFIHILEIIVDNINTKISDLCIIRDEEKNKLLNEFNNTNVAFNDYNISQKIEENAMNFPNNIAVIFENSSYTYDELNKKANQFANYLITLGVNKGDTLSIMLKRSENLIITILACLKLGVIYTLIDYTFPEERIRYIKENSNSKFIITYKDLVDFTFDNSIFMDELNFDNFSNNNLNIVVENTAPLCLIYTSGSTGEPKGVILRRNSFVNLMFAFDLDMNISLYKNILSIANVGFDMFLVEIFSALFFGNTIVLANELEQKEPTKIASLIKNNNVEFFVMTPSRVELLLSDGISDCLKNVKAFQLGGEVFTPQLYLQLQKNTNARMYNGYGPTETTACVCNKLVSMDDINIGKPISNIKIYICNNNLQLCPIGVVGEICVAGIGVSNGYFNNEKAKKASFVKNPFGDGYIYKTGDLGKYNFNGDITYIGRRDNQVKLRGLRIELSEIENNINAIDGISNSTVLCIDNSYLVGFYVSKVELDSSFVRNILAKSLPTYLIPRKLIHLYELPLNNNGKINKFELRKLIDSTNLSNAPICVPPENDTQKLYCDIWAKLLGTNIGIDDNLFEFGADSLLAIKFKIELLSHNINISYSDIFKYKTIRQLSENVEHIDSSSELTNYDYTKINNLLNNSFSNNMVSFSTSQDVLLLGGNGYVGMHIIYSFIKNCSGRIYCIVRNKDDQTAQERFLHIMHFYFGNILDDFINKRIIIIEGDILKENFGLSLKDYLWLSNHVDTIINSAANVKHFGDFEKFKSINLDSLYGIIDFCLKYNKRLIQISSLSVSGNAFLDNSTISSKNIVEDTNFSEKDLFINQSLDNVYTKSKFEAERLILEKIINDGLHAQILRLGNITSRFSDGKFQINPEENAFANRIKALISFKTLPDYILDSYMEFTPVDECADCIINILNSYYLNNYIYHIYNNNHIYFKDFVKMLNDYGFNISVKDEKSFLDIVNDSINKNEPNISRIINDFDENKRLNYDSNIKIESELSRNALKVSGFKWNVIDYTYIKKYLDYLKNINFI